VAASLQNQGNRPPGTHQDLTDPETWIRRLERPERIPGLRIRDVVASLELKSGDVVADIGSGAGAFAIPFAKAVAPFGKVLAVDIWPALLDHVNEKAKLENVTNLHTILVTPGDPQLPEDYLDVAFFHNVFHNMNDRQAYLEALVSSVKPGGRVAIVEQEFEDPIAKQWDLPEDRITKDQVKTWMANVGFHLVGDFDIFQGKNNPKGAGMPERWFVVYARVAVSEPCVIH
jgi:ubiquinone/menaquinone biosynthesis C-methylase UbiE